VGERHDQTARVRTGYNVLYRAYRADAADEATHSHTSCEVVVRQRFSRHWRRP